jgi:hypothetical protein
MAKFQPTGKVEYGGTYNGNPITSYWLLLAAKMKCWRGVSTECLLEETAIRSYVHL